MLSPNFAVLSSPKYTSSILIFDSLSCSESSGFFSFGVGLVRYQILFIFDQESPSLLEEYTTLSICISS